MLPWDVEFAGRLDRRSIDSQVLRENPLGDPHQRPVWVYTPPDYQTTSQRLFPTVYVLIGYGGYVTRWMNRPAYGQPFPELVDGLFARQQTPSTIVVYVDGWTAYGGSQYIDSRGTGRYHTHLCEEIVDFVDANYRTLRSPAHRAIMGTSSGGFGAIVSCMLRPDVFGALASHAGDAFFEVCYQPAMPNLVRALAPYGGDIYEWWRDFRSRVPEADAAESQLEQALGLAAAFSPRPDGTPELPVDTRTGRLRPDVWKRWLDWDPVRMAARYSEALRGLRAVWIEAGTLDEYHLDLGAQALHDAFQDAGVAADTIHFELVEGADHAASERRQPLSLAWLAARISA